MKRRLVKVVGVLIVLMVPLGFYALWPYWHPMWWWFPPRPDEQPMLEGLEKRLGPFMPSREFDEFEILAWKRNMTEALVFGVSRSDENYREVFAFMVIDSDLGSSWRVRNYRWNDVSQHLDSFTQAHVREDWEFCPDVWKRISGEVLAPARLKELKSEPPLIPEGLTTETRIQGF